MIRAQNLNRACDNIRGEFQRNSGWSQSLYGPAKAFRLGIAHCRHGRFAACQLLGNLLCLGACLVQLAKPAHPAGTRCIVGHFKNKPVSSFPPFPPSAVYLHGDITDGCGFVLLTLHRRPCSNALFHAAKCRQSVGKCQ